MGIKLQNPSINKIYTTEFRGHVAAFLESLKFNLKDKRVIISVSAGVDSIVLLDVMAKLNLSLTLEILHFNHSTRQLENQKEQELVAELAKHYKLSFHLKVLSFDLGDSNFEHLARLKRKETYQDFIKEGAIVLCAHHLNDSFEWSLMQSFKQSGLVTTLGIPVFNNGILRPFMCVSKSQILKYAKYENLKWLEDQSNEDLRFERNKLRKKLCAEIFSSYPKALKHYVARSNLLAQKLGVHADKGQGAHKLVCQLDRLGRIGLKGSHFKIHKDEIKKNIFDLSDSNRGLIDLELDKFLKLQEALLTDSKILSVKGPFRGPINFSGGVWGYIYKDEILMLNKDGLKKSLDLDGLIVERLKNKAKTSEITEYYYLEIFPYLLITPNTKKSSGSKLIHPLLPKTCQWLKENNITYTFDSSFLKKSEQNLASSALLLDSSRLAQ